MSEDAARGAPNFYVRLTDDGKHIRKWDRKPFDGATAYVRVDLVTLPASATASTGDVVERANALLRTEWDKIPNGTHAFTRMEQAALAAIAAALSTPLDVPPSAEMSWSDAADFVERYDLPDECIAKLATPTPPSADGAGVGDGGEVERAGDLPGRMLESLMSGSCGVPRGHQDYNDECICGDRQASEALIRLGLAYVSNRWPMAGTFLTGIGETLKQRMNDPAFINSLTASRDQH